MDDAPPNPGKSLCNLASICLMSLLTNSVETSTCSCPSSLPVVLQVHQGLPCPYISMHSSSSHRIHFPPFVGLGVGWEIAYFRALMMLPPSSIKVVSDLHKFLAQSCSLPLRPFPSLLRFVHLALFYLYARLSSVLSCN